MARDHGGDFVGDRDAALAGVHPTTGGAITRLAYARAKAAGVDLEPILKRTNLTLGQIEDPGARLRVRDQINFLNLAADELKDDLLGFHLALSPDLREIGWLYYVAASSETMGEALQRGTRYSTIANEGLSLHYLDNTNVVITVHHVGVSRHLDRHQIEFVMVALVRMCRQLSGIRVLPTRVQFMHHRERGCPEVVDFFGSDVEFGAEIDAATFAATIAGLPTVSADPYLNRLLVGYCEDALSRRPPRRGTFRASVENAIVPLLPHGKVQVGEIARRLGTSQRTFARRLSAEGVTFSEVLESLRSDLARRHLADSNISISEIAWLLGYHEVSAFTHAFKRWTGKTPREARSQIVPAH
jgi:AraC-like DNA-binding protein